MNQDTIHKMEVLLGQGKQDEARKLLRDVLAKPLTDEERGGLLVGFAAAYLALSNSVMGAYADSLEDNVEHLEHIATLEREVEEKLRQVQAAK